MATMPRMEGDHQLCISYAPVGKCTHQAAPRKLFGCADCIEDGQYRQTPKDPRLKVVCRLFESRCLTPPPKKP